MKLYIKPCANFKVKTVKDLVDSLFREENNGSRRSYSRTTYKDKKFTKVECSKGRRSFEDLLKIVRTRFPKCSEKCLMKVLKDLNIKFYRCYQIKKVVFHFVGSNFGSGLLTRDGFVLLPANDWKAGTYTPKRLLEIYDSL